MAMRFDEIEKLLGQHCDTAKCVRERVEMHRYAAQLVEAHISKFNPPEVPQVRLPFSQTKR